MCMHMLSNMCMCEKREKKRRLFSSLSLFSVLNLSLVAKWGLLHGDGLILSYLILSYLILSGYTLP